MTDSTAENLWISAVGGADELRSLHAWLTEEDVLRGRVRFVQGEVEPGRMGGLLEALTVAVSSGGAGAVLAGALSTWLSHRRSDVQLTVTGRDGRKVELDASRVDAQVVLCQVRELLDGPERPS